MGGATVAETCVRNNYLIVDLPRESLSGYLPRAVLKSLQHAHNMRCAATFKFLHRVLKTRLYAGVTQCTSITTQRTNLSTWPQW